MAVTLPDADHDTREPRLVPLVGAPLFAGKTVQVHPRKIYQVKVFLRDGSGEVGFPTLLAVETTEDEIFARWGFGRYRCRLVSVTPDDAVEVRGYDTPGGSVNVARGEWPAPPTSDDEVPDLTDPAAAVGIGSEPWPVDPARLSPDAQYEYHRRRAIFEARATVRSDALKRARAAVRGPAPTWAPQDDGAPPAPREESIERLLLLRMVDKMFGAPSQPDPLAHERALAEIRRQERDDEWRRTEARAAAEHARQLELVAAQARAAGALTPPPRAKSEAEIRAEVLLEQQRARVDPRDAAQAEIDRAVAFARSLGYQRPSAGKASDDDDANVLGPIFEFMQSPIGEAIAKRFLGPEGAPVAAPAAQLTAGVPT